MTWRDRLVPASFGDAPFWVDSLDLDQGPRAFVQKFPGTGRVEVQNLGNDAREITVNAYLIGPNYDFDRDVLEAALLEGGVKALTLPWRGTKNVTIDQKFKTHESKSQGGYCSISFHCVEDVPEEPFSRAWSGAQLDTQADTVMSGGQNELGKKLSMNGLPSSKQVSTISALTAASNALGQASDRIAAAAGIVNDAKHTVESFTEDVGGLLSAPGDLAEQLAGVVTTALDVADAAIDALEMRKAPRRELARVTDIALNAALDVLAFAADSPSVNTGSANGQREAENLAVTTRSTQAMVVSRAAQLAVTLPFESFTQAASVRTRFVEAFDAILGNVSDEMLDDVLLLQARVVQHLDEVAAALPDLRTYTTSRMISAAEVAHEVYGDASRADEVADRNRIGHPLFIPAGVTLELLAA